MKKKLLLSSVSALAFGVALACSAPSNSGSDGGDGEGSTSSGGKSDGGFEVGSGGTGGGTTTNPEDCKPVLEVVIRDFNTTHPDFESYDGLNDVGCGMVAAELGDGSKPVFVSGSGTQKRVVEGDWAALKFKQCESYNGWVPSPVITSSTTFDQWYRDVEGVNVAVPIKIDFVEQDGKFVYDSTAFFPVDGLGLNEATVVNGATHNFHFTTEGHVKFTYQKGQKFTFRGDDDLWIFVNGKLALDLGGMHMPISATIDFDAMASDLGISVGGTYQMDIFHAERHTKDSNFRIETDISCFETVTVN